MANKGSEYTKRQDGPATVFEVTPAPSPKFTYLLIIGGFFSLIALAANVIFGALLAAFIVWYGWFRDMRPKGHREVSTFRVMADSIEAGGQTFKKEDIHRLILKNGITDQELMETYTTNANAAAGMAHRANVARVANSLNVEQGGKSFQIAGGMDETTAYGLLRDVCKVLDFDVK
ncbi:MAG TPA: hypothetical protein PLV61_16480 [Parvularculaceae bacterium]|nr:hypothetical protein [Caulobacterales bacterium]HPE32792.1 hypothetical protein [Parvularculaceae bacterium]HRX40098.1 hypothetical protein [Parvularculaceae bacterium]